MGMVEKVARAMAAADTLSNVDAYSWQLWPASKRDPYMMRARVAIQAMREPTEEMMTAGASMHWDDYRYRDESTRDQWDAMIDAALKEQEKVG